MYFLCIKGTGYKYITMYFKFIMINMKYENNYNKPLIENCIDLIANWQPIKKNALIVI